MNENKSCITINCGCCGDGTSSGSGTSSGDGAPIGTVISYMGTKTPAHYLSCDGAVFSITDYPKLSE